jgi:hypothetical protein
MPIEWLDGFAAADSTASAMLLSSKAAIVSAIKALVLFIMSPFDRKPLARKKIKAFLSPFTVYSLTDRSFLFISVHLRSVYNFNGIDGSSGINRRFYGDSKVACACCLLRLSVKCGGK